MSGAVLDALVIGAGPAGLATSHELRRRGVRHEVLERGAQVGAVWANLYDSLVLHTGKHLSHLPGARFPAAAPLWLPRADFVRYLEDYARRFALPVRTGIEVRQLRRERDGWIADTTNGLIAARAVVVCTGIVSSPRLPAIPGRERYAGQVLHSSQYHRPGPFVGKRVLVVGVGNSGGEIGAELARAGADVSVAVRSGANVVPRDLGGIPIQYVAAVIAPLPKAARAALARVVQAISEKRRGPSPLPRPAHGPLDGIPLIGFALPDAITAGRVQLRPGVESFTEDGVRFTDGRTEPFDVVLLATGFDAAIHPLLEGLVTRDAKGFAKRRDRVTSAEQPGLWFVGHVYDARGGLANIRADSARAADGVAAALGRR